MARTGFPVNVIVDRSSSDVPDGNTNSQRPDLVPGVSLIPPGGSSIAQWMNPAAFTIPASGTFGNAPRDVGRGPGAWQLDLGLAKRIPFTERFGLSSARTFSISLTTRNMDCRRRTSPDRDSAASSRR